MRTGARAARAVLLVATLALTCESASAIRPAGWRPSGTHGPTTDADSGSPAAVGSVDDAASTAEASSEPQPEPIPAPASGTPVASDAAPEIAMPARYDDAGFAEVGGDAASLRRTPLPGCAMHVFRHVSKAAGTTMRFIFDKQVAMGEWEFLPMCHYGFREKDWRETVREIPRSRGGPRAHRVRSRSAHPRGGSQRVGRHRRFRERHHEGPSRTSRAHRRRGLRGDLLAALPRAGVAVPKLPRVLHRETPRRHESRRGPRALGRQLRRVGRASAGHPASRTFRRSVHPSAPRTTLRRASGEGGDDAVVRVGPRPLPETCKISLGDRSRFERLVADVDVVGVTDRFDLFWLQLADVVGFQHLEYSPE